MAINIKRWLFPFAVAGDKTPIPEAVDPAGAVSYPQGWGPDYERDPATDPLAKRIPRLESNQAMYDVTATLKDLQEQGLSWFIAAAQNEGVAFPYIKGARVLYDNVGDVGVYESLVDSNTSAPTDASKWMRDVAARFATQSEAAAGSSGVVMVAPREMSRAVQSGRWNYATAAGTANALTVTLDPALTNYVAGVPLRVVPGAGPNTGPVTLNAGAGALPVRYPGGRELYAGEIVSGRPLNLLCMGAWWALQNPVEYFERMTPKRARNTSAFSGNVVISDISGVNSANVVQTISVSGITYLDVTAYCAIRNTVSTFVGVIAFTRLVRSGHPDVDSQYLGTYLNNNIQIPLSIRSIYQNLDPTATYTVQLITQKDAAVGPVGVLDTYLSATSD